MDFNIFDAVVISITLILAIKGYFSGIIKELSGLLGIVLGLFLGTIYYKNVGDYINSSILKIPNESAINVVGFVAVFVLVWMLIVLFGMLLSKMLKIARLGILDRIGGVLFSAGKFFVIVSVIVTMLSQIEALKKTLSKYEKNSVMWPIMQNLGNTLIHLKPEDIQNQIDEMQKKVNNGELTTSIKKTINEAKTKIVKEINASLQQKQTKGE